jgi:hypothetical protein
MKLIATVISLLTDREISLLPTTDHLYNVSHSRNSEPCSLVLDVPTIRDGCFHRGSGYYGARSIHRLVLAVL